MKNGFSETIAVTMMALMSGNKKPQPTIKELQRSVGIWRLVSSISTWWTHLLFVVYSASLLGYLHVAFWIWIIWAAFIIGHFVYFFVSHSLFTAQCELADRLNAELSTTATPTTEESETTHSTK